MKHEPISFDNARIFGIDTNYPFLRLQDGTFIELSFGVRFETDFPKDYSFALECAEFIQDHYEAIRKGQKLFKVGSRLLNLRIFAPVIEEANFDCGEIRYYYNGIFNCKMTQLRFYSNIAYNRFVGSEIEDWILDNHELCTSQACNNTEAFVLRNDISICEIESCENQDELFTCEKCNHTLSVSYSLKDPRCCLLCDESIPTSELLK